MTNILFVHLYMTIDMVHRTNVPFLEYSGNSACIVHVWYSAPMFTIIFFLLCYEWAHFCPAEIAFPKC
ncbi:hypothetical protein BDV27DRAFT_120856, partial [Aspergillus caelatus]